MTERIDAVLPLTARDLPRAHILLASLRRNARGLGVLWVISEASEYARVRTELARAPGPWRLQVLPETELAPELRFAPGFRGWYRQQLLKLAIAERIATPHYLTFDADVICVRAVSPADLAPGGKALCHITPADLHADWYQHSSALLGLSSPRRGVSHDVTPAVLSRAAVLELQAYLDARALSGVYRAGWSGLRQRIRSALARAVNHGAIARAVNHGAITARAVNHCPLAPAVTGSRGAWRAYLIAGTPWTEYALYYTFLEATGRFDDHHTLSARGVYSSEHSVWRADAPHFDAWDPQRLFQGAGPPYFVVVQSITQLAPERVWAKVAGWLDEPAL